MKFFNFWALKRIVSYWRDMPYVSKNLMKVISNSNVYPPPPPPPPPILRISYDLRLMKIFFTNNIMQFLGRIKYLEKI